MKKSEQQSFFPPIFPPDNVVVEQYIILKWDIIFNILLFTGYLWANGYYFFGILIYLQIYTTSWYMFTYRGSLPAYIFFGLSLIPFTMYLLNLWPDLPTFLLWCGWSCVAYGFYWFILATKNRKKYEKSIAPQICKYCGLPNKNFLVHMGEKMCEACYLREALQQLNYHGTILYRWDYDLLMFFETQIKSPIPHIERNPTEIYPDYDTQVGFISEAMNIVQLILPNQGISELPELLGYLVKLRVIYLKNNQISFLPPTIGQLYSLKLLNIEKNNIKFIPIEIELALKSLRERGCKVIR